ncbi:MAG: histidine kinase [Bacteroidales bacterium]|nr:histidine kinase [Bacteroidales bacterium]
MTLRLNTSTIIHGFAVLHVAGVVLCRLAGINDDLILTSLTIFMTVILCLRYHQSVQFSATVIIIANIVGYLMGTGIAALVNLFVSHRLLSPTIATFTTTETIGWGLAFFLKQYSSHSSSESRATPKEITLLIIAIAAVLALRFIIRRFSSTIFSGELLLGTLALMASILIYSVIYMVEYAFTARRNAEKERDKAELAKFQYLNLKRQVNPHFLFNSLNILDALVLDGKDEEASVYIHKLAGIYRYMLKNEDESTVSLRDEMTYVEMYMDLLKVRFQEGLEMEVDIPGEDMSKSVIPCSVQLLLENATKHNAVSPDRPLRVSITSNGQHITVTNNLIPRLTPSQSSGMGLNYIREQYNERSPGGVEVIQTGDEYTVKLPLL